MEKESETKLKVSLLVVVISPNCPVVLHKSHVWPPCGPPMLTSCWGFPLGAGCRSPAGHPARALQPCRGEAGREGESGEGRGGRPPGGAAITPTARAAFRLTAAAPPGIRACHTANSPLLRPLPQRPRAGTDATQESSPAGPPPRQSLPGKWAPRLPFRPYLLPDPRRAAVSTWVRLLRAEAGVQPRNRGW